MMASRLPSGGFSTDTPLSIQMYEAREELKKTQKFKKFIKQKEIITGFSGLKINTIPFKTLLAQPNQLESLDSKAMEHFNDCKKSLERATAEEEILIKKVQDLQSKFRKMQ